MRKCGLKVAKGGRQGRPGAPKAAQVVPQSVHLEHPGAPNPQNIAFYHEKTLIFTKSTNPHFCQLLAPVGGIKVMPKVPRGAPRVCPAPSPQGRQKVSPKMTTTGTSGAPNAPKLSRQVPGSLLGYPPHGKSSKKGGKTQQTKREKLHEQGPMRAHLRLKNS